MNEEPIAATPTIVHVPILPDGIPAKALEDMLKHYGKDVLIKPVPVTVPKDTSFRKTMILK